MEQSTYPVQFSVDYPDRPLDRVKTAFRLILAIPILIVAGLIERSSFNYTAHGTTTSAAVGAGGLLFLAPLVMIVFRQKYPRWWFDWNLELMRFENRVAVYVALMDDESPSTTDSQRVRLDFPYPTRPTTSTAGCPW